jgi:hypothetical protein
MLCYKGLQSGHTRAVSPRWTLQTLSFVRRARHTATYSEEGLEITLSQLEVRVPAERSSAGNKENESLAYVNVLVRPTSALTASKCSFVL